MIPMSIKMTELQYKHSINHLCNQNVAYTPFISFKNQMNLNVTIIWQFLPPRASEQGNVIGLVSV